MPQIVPIEDPADPRIEDYLDIRDRDLARRDGLFMAEGKVVLAQLLAVRPDLLKSVLLAAHRVGSLSALLAAVPPGVPIFAASQRVLDAIAGFPIHRGILAVGHRADGSDADTLLGAMPERAVVVVLVGIANHDNMGGIFRNAAAFGAAAVLLDSDCCDPLYRKAIRVSVGAALRVPFSRLAPQDGLLNLLARHGFAPIALSPSGALRLAELRPARRTAILLGAEGPGLPAHLIDGATSICIPIQDGFDSLNVATTSGIVVNHLANAR